MAITKKLSAGVYIFVENPTAPSNSATVPMNYRMHYLTANDVYANTTVEGNVIEVSTGFGGIIYLYPTSEIGSKGFPQTIYSVNSAAWRASGLDGTTYTVANTTLLRTITVETDTTVPETFYTWFTANTVLQPKLSVDLTTLSGWANLAPGNHTIKIVAKGTGYRDSEKSAGVSVTKGAVVSYTNVTLEKLNSLRYSKISNADTSKYYLLRYLTPDDYGTAYLYWDNSASVWKVENSGSDRLIGIVNSKSNNTEIVFFGADLYKGAFYAWQNCQCLSANVKPESATIPESVFTENGATVQSIAYYVCIIEGTLITLADGTKKPVEDITYNDDILCWDFYKGKLTSAKPAWITAPHIADCYNLCKFSNGAEVGFVGMGGTDGYHRIYNDEAKAFTHTGVPETPIGTTTFAEDGTFPKLVEQQIVKKEVKFYNIGTEKHFNLFTNGILTSSRISNCYKIKDMKYYGEQLIPDEEIAEYIEKKRNY